ncbi:MAG TPA: hypothetical protein VGM91_04340 [Conexibacter sp.]|jgi:hypothetical protein
MPEDRRILVTVTIPGATIEAVERVARERPELGAKLRETSKRHGSLSHRRLFRDGEILDIDEWPSEQALDAFLAEAEPIIQELQALRGSGAPVHTVWHDLAH